MINLEEYQFERTIYPNNDGARYGIPVLDKKIVIPISGGMDSSTLLYMAVDSGYNSIHLLSFYYGQRHVKELDCIKLQIDDVLTKAWKEDKCLHIEWKTIDVSYIKEISPTSSLTNLEIDNPKISEMAGDAQPVSYVPFRNMMFLSICCAYAESCKCDTVCYGAAEIDSAAGYWDCSPEFLNSINSVTALNRANRIKIVAPLLTMSKAKIISEGVRLGVDYSRTWTCYSNREDGLADATTPSSSLRLKGFIDAGYKDPIQYAQQDKIEEQYQKFKCKEITYDDLEV